MKKILKKLISLFKKKKYYTMPSEWLVIDWTDEAKEYNLREDINKEIKWMENDEEKEPARPYSKEVLYAFHKNFHLPFWDFTKNDGKLETIDTIRPEVLEYQK